MQSPYNRYVITLFNTVLEGVREDRAPLSFTEKIHEAIQPYLRPEYQRPEPPLHEV